MADHTKWMQDGPVTARCRAHECDWQWRGKTLSAMTAAAKNHADEHGHEVERVRRQWSLTSPSPE